MLPGTSTIAAYENCLETDPMFVNPSGGSGSSFSAANALWAPELMSPAIDSGAGTLEELSLENGDYFGNARLQGEGIDIGAYEGFYAPFDSDADLNDDGAVSTADLLLILGGYGCTGPGCEVDLNGDGNTGAADILTFLASYAG